ICSEGNCETRRTIRSYSSSKSETSKLPSTTRQIGISGQKWLMLASVAWTMNLSAAWQPVTKPNGACTFMLRDVMVRVAEFRPPLNTEKFSQKATKETKTIAHMIQQNPL